MQTVVWHQTAGGASAAHDVCICAPTGSGKTLAYALPVLQALAGRAVPRLRALAVLPTRDLAAQVFAVLSELCPALGLTACLAAGKASLAAEAGVLAGGGVGERRAAVSCVVWCVLGAAREHAPRAARQAAHLPPPAAPPSLRPSPQTSWSPRPAASSLT